MTWRTPALVLLLSGCLAHERPGDVDAAVLPDAFAVAQDAGAAADAWRPGDVDGGPVCGPSTAFVGVRVEAITAETDRCVFTHWEHAALTSVEPAPTDDGIRIHFDLCPAADADCRCDVVITHVGTDIASSLHADPNVTIDITPGDGFVPGALVAITKVPTCACDDCGCSEPLYLYAATGPSDFARLVPAPMTFSRGLVVCPENLCDFGGTWTLHAHGGGAEDDIGGGETRNVGPVRVRSVRDVEVWEPCADCAQCGTALGAWIAWVPT